MKQTPNAARAVKWKGSARGRRSKTFAGALFVALSVYFAGPTPACGPFLPEAVFTEENHPDQPLEHFATGKLGIVLRTFDDVYLLVAYRNLSGVPLSKSEKDKFLADWGPRLNSPYGYAEPTMPPGSGPIERWAKARKDAGAQTEGRELYGFYGQDFIERSFTVGDNYIFYANCLGPAFDTAIATLEERKKTFGAESSEAKAWLAAQDTVFSNCRGPVTRQGQSAAAAVPLDAKQSDPPLVRQDRAYQIAAAYFYAGDFDQARRRFEVIARDAESPWNHTAEFLVGRSLLRKATLAVPTDVAVLGQAEAQLLKVADDPQCPEMHVAAQRLLNFVDLRLHGDRRFRELSDAIAKKDSSADFSQNLTDYLWLLRSNPTRESKETDPEPIRWLDAFTINSPEEQTVSIARWKARHSDEWLVAALAGGDASTKELPQLLDAAEKVPPASSAFATVSFHRARLLGASGRDDDARQALDVLLALGDSTFPQSSRNLLLALRLRLARNLDEFLEFAPRVPAEVDYWGAYTDPSMEEYSSTAPENRPRHPIHAYFDADSLWAMRDYFSTKTLIRAVNAAKLPRSLEREVAPSTWVRAQLLGDKESSDSILPAIEELYPDLKPGLEENKNTSDAAARQFGAAFIMLRNPGMRPYFSTGVGRTTALSKIDEYRDNWWCTPQKLRDGRGDRPWSDAGSSSAPAHLAPVLESGQPPVPKFLADEDARQAKAENGRLREVPAAPNYLAEIVLRWAKEHPDDSRVPEALHLAVRATRYGCEDAQTSSYSKAAFELLHRKYPNSEWTAKTKYWF